MAFPLLGVYLCLRVARNRSYARGLAERFGFLSAGLRRPEPGAIWLHAVSVGEALTAVGLLKRLKQELPEAPVYVSTTTLAGRAMADQKLKGLAAGVFYTPFDYVFAVRRVLRWLRPSLVIVMETEIWPNLYRESRQSGARLLVANGRISDKALPAYRRWAWFFRAALAWPDSILAQDETAAARYRELGAERVEAAGNLKYDFDPAATSIAPPVRAWLAATAPALTWIAASTMPPAVESDPDEDDVVLDAFESLAGRHPGLLLILVPRRPERFDAAADKLAARAIPFVRRSQLDPAQPVALPGVLLVDTIGELSGLFRCADVVFMGGTIAHRGGHNILEPAAFGTPVVIGPHMENFSEIAAEFRSGGGVLAFDDAAGLAPAVDRLLSDEALRRSLGETGRRLSDLRRGATSRALRHIQTAYDDALPRLRGWNPLAPLWRAGVALDRARSSPRRLPVPTISVGNLSVGGTGKTPFCIWLGDELAQAGQHPAVLLRGYRRTAARSVAVLAPGAQLPVGEVGEEALLLSASGLAVGVGADRAAAFDHLQRHCPVDVALLDDGFQHWALRRDLDIVLVDAVDPFRGGLLPRGRLREPFGALERAQIVVLTRTVPGRPYAGLREEIRRHNPAVEIFHARAVATLPAGLSGRPGAFCGLGNPQGFRATLAALGVDPVVFQAFADHHHYQSADLEPLSRQADVLLTTEKDRLNIPDAVARACRVEVVRMRLKIEEPERLLGLIQTALRR